MTNIEYQNFAKNYSKDDFGRIKFAWNGKHGDDLIDTNYDFRMNLCQAIKDNLSIGPDQLIIDLYIELSKCAKQTFGVYNSFHLFGNEILSRGGTKYFDLYIEGASKSMDTLLMSARLDLNKERIIEILDYINDRLNEAEPPKGYDHMKQRFEWLLNKK